MIKTIRILQFVKSLDMGGMEKSTILYSNILSKKVNFVGIYAKRGFYDDSGLVSERVLRFYPKRDISNYFSFLTNLLQILSIINREKISHIHYHHRIFIPFIFFIKFFLPKVNIIYSHQNVFNDKVNKLILADKIIALTKATKDDLPNWLKVKTTIIPHGVFLPTKEITRIKKPVNFGYVGRFVKWKGVLTLIHEFAKFKKENVDIKLVLIGEGPLKAEMFEAIRLYGLENVVQILKPQVDLEKVYKLIDVLILPSKEIEGFGIVLVEAMSYAKPVIVYDIGVYSQTVIDNYNGLIVKESLVESMRRIISEKNLYPKLSENAYTFSQNYDINLIVERYISEIYYNN